MDANNGGNWDEFEATIRRVYTESDSLECLLKKLRERFEAKKDEILHYIIYQDNFFGSFHVANVMADDVIKAKDKFVNSPFYRRCQSDSINVLSAPDFQKIFPKGPKYYYVYYKTERDDRYTKVLAISHAQAVTIFESLYPTREIKTVKTEPIIENPTKNTTPPAGTYHWTGSHKVTATIGK